MTDMEEVKPVAKERWREFVLPGVFGLLIAALLFQGTTDITRSVKGYREAEDLLSTLKEKDAIDPGTLKEAEEGLDHLKHMLYMRGILLVIPLLLLLAGKIGYDALAKTSAAANFRKRFLYCMLGGLVLGCVIHAPVAYLNQKVDAVHDRLKAEEITKAEADDAIVNLNKFLLPLATLQWWFGIPLAMAFLCLLVPYTSGNEDSPRTLILDVVMASFLMVLVGTHLIMLNKDRSQWKLTIWMQQELQGGLTWMHTYFEKLSQTLHLPGTAPDWGRVSTILEYGIPVLLCYAWVTRPIRFGLGLGAIMLASAFYNMYYNDSILMRERSFFGVLKLEESVISSDKRQVHYHRLVHGTTLHGKQETDAEGHPVHNAEPLTYYHRTGPLGQVFAMIEEMKEDTRPIALIGLGTGTTACYGKPGQEVVFYEIDTKVKAIAEDEKYFSYLQDARDRGVNLNFVMGDARLSMKKEPKDDPEGRPDGHFRLIVVDAFSSDAIPKHLITREALALYVRKAAPDGVIAFHISNRYLDLEPVLATLAKDKDLKCLVRHDSKEDFLGKAASTWVILARSDHYEKAFGSILKDVKETRDDDKKWYWIEQRKRFRGDAMPDVKIWTDDYQNILSIFMW